MWAIAHFVFVSFVYLVLLLAGLFAVVIAIQARRISQQTIPGVPWVGLKDRRVFPKLRACLGELAAGRTMIEEGWQKVSWY